MSIGLRLRSERERLGLSQTQLGEAANATKQTQFAYETDRTPPKATYLAAVATLGVDVAFVITGERLENVASTATELAYLRKARELYQIGGVPLMDDGLKGLNFLIQARGLRQESRVVTQTIHAHASVGGSVVAGDMVVGGKARKR